MRMGQRKMHSTLIITHHAGFKASFAQAIYKTQDFELHGFQLTSHAVHDVQGLYSANQQKGCWSG
jgi:hypothetical protein